MEHNSFPITPPQWQVDAWCKQALAMGADVDAVFLEAARWGADQQLKLDAEQIAQAHQAGADQELEACVNYVDNTISGNKARALRAVRRPKPPSLKEQALESLHHLEAGCAPNVDLLRRALESLPD